MKEKILRLLKVIANPVIRELPFIIAFLLLMGITEMVGMIHGSLVAPQLYPPLLDIAGWVGFSFLVAFVLASIVTYSHLYKLRFIWYSISLILYSVKAFLKVNFDWSITPAVLTMIAETNSTESSEFIKTYLTSPLSLNILYTIIASIVIIVCAETLYKRFSRGGQITMPKAVVTTTLVLPLLALGLYSFYNYKKLFDNNESVESLTSHLEENFIVSPLDRLIWSMGIINKSGSSLAEAVDKTNQISGSELAKDCPDSLNVILVIGESYIKWHSHLYGYNLHTTPNMDKEKENGNLFVFNNVITPYNHTSESIKNIFSCNTLGNGESWHSKPIFPSIFKQAGYYVLFWDNQRAVKSMFDTWSFTLDAFLYHPEIISKSYTKTNQRNFRYDEDLIDDFINSTSDVNNPHKLVLFHLMGQHLLAEERYPHNSKYNYFTPDSILRNEQWMTEKKKKMIADYDNATLYNDYVISKIINYYRNSNSILIYLSDHGEEIYDYRDAIGRNHSKDLDGNLLKYQFEIPFIIWVSDKFKNNNKETYESIHHAVNKPFMIDNVCQLLFHCGYVITPYYKSENDIISSEYSCPKRLVRGSVDYDHFIQCRN